MKKSIMPLLALVFAYAILQSAHAQTANHFKAKLRPGVHVELGTQVYSNSAAPATGKTVLFLPGLVQTANTWLPLKNALFADPTAGTNIHRTLLFDFPGKGTSGLPKGKHSVRLGNLTLEDETTAFEEGLDEYDKRDISPTVVGAHSMASFPVMMLQTKLLAACKTMLSEYGIKLVVLVGPTAPVEVFDPFVDSTNALNIVNTYSNYSAELGPYVAVDPFSARLFFFSDTSGNFLEGLVPTEAEIEERGYLGVESYTAARQALSPGTERPSIPAGIFAPSKGTELRVIFGADDPLSDRTTMTNLYIHLTGDTTCSNVFPVPGPFPGSSFHNFHTYIPEAAVPYIRPRP